MVIGMEVIGYIDSGPQECSGHDEGEPLGEILFVEQGKGPL